MSWRFPFATGHAPPANHTAADYFQAIADECRHALENPMIHKGSALIAIEHKALKALKERV